MSNTNTINSNSSLVSFWLKAAIGFIALALFTFNYAKAQTQPPAQTLPYSLTSHSGSTLPAGWAAHDQASTTRTLVTATANLAYTATSGNVGWSDEGANGISILSARSQASSFVLAINTVGRTNISLSWISRLIATNSIGVTIGLQYRVGTTGSYTDIGNPSLDFNSAGTSPSSYSTILPVGAENQAVVQLRWITWQDNNGVNPHARVAIDDIVVCSAATPSVSIAITTGAQSICTGTSVTFTATPTNGGTPSYQWKVNGANVGTNSNTFTSTTLATGNSVTCVMTSTLLCASPTTATSNAIVMTVAADPTASNAGSPQSVCATTATLAGNTPAVGTGAWTVIAGSGSVTTPSSPTSGVTGLSFGANTFRWTISNSPCTASFSDVTITRENFPTTSNAGPNQAFCSNSSTTLAANTPVVGTGMWSVISGTGSFVSNSNPGTVVNGLSFGDNVFQWTISNGSCTPSTSQVTITRNALPAETASSNSPVCEGSNLNLLVTGPGTSTYAWTGPNGFSSSDKNPAPFTAVAASAGVYTVTVTDNNGCVGVSQTPTVVVNTLSVDPTSVTSSNGSSICEGTSTTLTVQGGSLGTDAVWTWYDTNCGGVSIATGPSIIVSPTSSTNYFVRAEGTCGNSNCTDISITVIPAVVPAVSITSNSNPICPGVSVTFTATPTNGGSTPAYQWKVNGGNVGIDNFQYTTSALNPGDVVTVELTSNENCAAPTTALSTGLAVYSATLPFTTNFNSTACWTISHVGATPAGDWTFASSMSNPTLNPVQGTQMAYFNSNSFAAGATSRLMSPRLAMNTMSEPYLRIQLSRDAALPNNKDMVEIYVSTDDGATWTPKALRAPIRPSAAFATPGWFAFELDLTPFKGSSQVRIALHAVSAAGNNLAIDEFAILEASCPVPKNRTVANLATGSATLKFNPAAGSSSYRIRWTAYADTAGWLPAYSFLNTTDTSYTATSLIPNTKYIWWVSSTCSGSTIGYQCYADTFTTLNSGTLPCVKPFGISHSALTASTATGNWDIRITADTFKIRYAEVGSAVLTYKFITGNPGVVSSYTMTGLKPSTTYYWQVATVCSGVSTTYTAPDTFTTPTAYISCVKPYGIYSNAITPTTANAGWDSLVIADEFRVRYWVDAGPVDYKYVLVSGGTPGNYTKFITISNLLPGTNYKFQIRTQCTGFKSVYSDVGTFTTLPAPARFSQIENTLDAVIGNAEIFPNPGNGNFNIQISSKEETSVNYTLFDLSGRNLNKGVLELNTGNNVKTMNFEGLAAGTYFLKLDHKDYSRSTRIIVQ